MESESENQSSRLSIWNKNCLKTRTGQQKMLNEFQLKLDLKKHRFINGTGIKRRN